MVTNNLLQRYGGLAVNVGKTEGFLSFLSGAERRYEIIDPTNGQTILVAHGSSEFTPLEFIGGKRPLTININEPNGKLLMSVRRNFSWFISHIEMMSPNGTHLGKLESKFRLISRQLDLFDENELVATVCGSFVSGSHFTVRKASRSIALITKLLDRISPQVRRADDTYYLEFTDRSIPASVRWLLLGVSLVVHSMYFSGRDSSRGEGAVIRSDSALGDNYDPRESSHSRDILGR